ncbi:MAG: GAF domain-containing protein [Anaerolineaceae bacterium]|nr:GAF domain-containing protein [Anaerolineaceae bacterium]
MMVIKSNIAYRLAVITGLIGFIIISLARFLAVWLTAQADPAQGFASHLFLLLLIELPLAFLAALILSSLVFWVTRTLVSKPLEELKHQSQRLATGEWVKLGQNDRSDEIGQVIRSFNHMAEQLQARFADLTERTTSRARDLQIAADVSRQITTVLDIDQLLQQVVTLTVRGFKLYSASIFLMDDPSRKLISAASADATGQIITDQMFNTIPFDAEPSIIALSARSRQAIVIDDVRRSAAYLPITALPDTRSEAAIPLILQGRLLGVFDLEADTPHRFGEDELRVLKTLAAQIAVAVRNARLFTEQGRVENEIRELNENLEQRVFNRTRELSALYAVASAASESLDLGSTLKRSLERVLTVVHSNTGAIHLLDEANNTLNLAIEQGLTPDTVLTLRTVPLNGGPVRRVLQEGRHIITVEDAELRAIAPSIQPELHGYVGLPMRARNQTMGLLSIFTRAGQRPLTEEEVALLTAIADQIGVVIESTHLRLRAEQAAVMEERERLARELHDSVTQSLYSLTLLAEWASDLLIAQRADEARQRLVEIGQTAQQALREMRLFLFQLRPAILEQMGLASALQQRLDAVERRVGVEARLQADESLDLPAPVEDALYLITLEALNNALKHAAATVVIVRLRRDADTVELLVEDNGAGFTLKAPAHKGGLGLISMRERAEQIGAALVIAAEPACGTTVKVTLKM